MRKVFIRMSKKNLDLDQPQGFFSLLATAFLGMLLSLGATQAHAQTKLSVKSVEGAKTVSVNEAKALFVKGVKFFDVRTNVAFNDGRIPGSILLDIKQDFNEKKVSGLVSINEPFVIYCSGETCLRAGKASKMAVLWGYTNVHYFRDGLPAWEANNHPVE